jgi:hypothetical protein
MLLNSDELVSLAHLPTAAVRSHKLRREVKRTKAAPAVVKVGGIVLGDNLHEGHVSPVSLTAEQRTRHMHVIGASGTGLAHFIKLVAGALGWRYEDEAPIPGGRADLLLERDGERIGIQVSNLEPCAR